VLWDSPNSPFLDAVPDHVVEFPYVVFEIPQSSIPRRTFEYEYTEELDVKISVVGLWEHVVTIGSPYKAGSVFDILDLEIARPESFSGDGFVCARFARTSWLIKVDPIRKFGGAGDATAGERVYRAVCMYDMRIEKPPR
jgi:hypothetical protein